MCYLSCVVTDGYTVNKQTFTPFDDLLIYHKTWKDSHQPLGSALKTLIHTSALQRLHLLLICLPFIHQNVVFSSMS